MSWLDFLDHPDALLVLVVHEVGLGHEEELLGRPLLVLISLVGEAKGVVVPLLEEYLVCL